MSMIISSLKDKKYIEESGFNGRSRVLRSLLRLERKFQAEWKESSKQRGKKVPTYNKVDNKESIDQAEHSSADSKLISEIIKSFESINENCKNFYGNKTQRKACEDLIKSYTFERVRYAVEKVLPATLGRQHFPTITTPVQLRDKWASLKVAVAREQAKEKAAKPNYIWGTPL